ncbi:MAG TPA: sigma-54 dependent transcriptional regulator, partial [bacterium]|nr:sigma-54 dependent transcriptional regulator [bacterium]
MAVALDIVLVSSRGPELAEQLTAAGHAVAFEPAPSLALARVARAPADVIVLEDVADVPAIVFELRRLAKLSRIMVITTKPTVEEALSTVKAGAAEYLSAPVGAQDLLSRLAPAIEERSRRDMVAAGPDIPALVGNSAAIAHLRGLVDLFSRSDAPVLITGETGSGKEVVAHALHDLSRRAKHPFIAVNCAAFPETLLEAELFGHERGAFTGAVKKREGRFKAADHGTLLLDEIGEMSIPSQAKLLRVLQEKSFEPLGTNVSVSFDVRILAATHRDLKEMVAEGKFREDLYYRLKILELAVPPLRERRADIPLLAEHFLKIHAGAANVRISPAALAALATYPFAGNV